MGSCKQLRERRKSSKECSSADPQQEWQKASSGQRNAGSFTLRDRCEPRLPFSSALVSNFAGAQDIGKALQLCFPLQADWMQQALGTVNNGKHLLAGAMSAIFSKSATAPLERIKMEMQLKQRSNTIEVAKQILKDGGYLTFWQGNGMNLLRVTPHKAVNFYSFYLYRTALKKTFGHVDGSGLLRFVAGALAGSTATLTCFPLDVIRTRMLSKGGEKYATAIGTLKEILAEESFGSFYVGCLPAIVSTAASGALFYGVYDLLKDRYIRKTQAKDHKKADDVVLSAGRTMLYGALAGAAAESILYPLEVLRRRMQLQNMQATEVMMSAQQVERMTLAAATEVYSKAGHRCKARHWCTYCDTIVWNHSLSGYVITAFAAERGIFAGAGSQSVPMVHQIAASAMRKPHLRRLVNASVEIYKMDGLLGFYQGFMPHILQVLPSAALSYYFYEACKRALKVQE